MNIPAAYMTPAGMAATLEAAQAQRERLAGLRRQRQQALEFERHMTDEQRFQRAMFEARMRSNRLRAVPTCFGELS